ncbi:efflux RND transporter periplasmic adaptor subunit [Pseudomonas sp. 5P_3.1_Bac2]|uniref:efflux RND transporter periplasmic adaptor subunit n=1 Tax=Pseudomonas sp. 5P_3.1_Bac2 TaxID=2971617 RepID=UPI0021C6C658|nr:efflux RND transporter periplasmic adaptor subunit [Pseudomonas sp. 5P_3.1_Bac2]MCU1718141.1 efflux RND transporter periplasmic adaptor subunit [Pseudomonas sp. 5P_3.1_Bac2]
MKKALLLAAVTLLAGAGAYVWWSHDARPEEAPPPASIKVALGEVRSQTIPRYHRSVGTLEALQQVQISAEVEGQVRALHFDSGQQVKAGEPLLRLNDAPEQAQRLRLRAQLRNAEQRLKRINQLLPSRASTPEQQDQARSERDALRAELAQQDALIDQKNIRAPFSGQLGVRRVNLGQHLNPGDAIVSLSDNRHLRVNFALEEQLSAQLQLNQSVELRLPAVPDHVFMARINAIEPILDSARMAQIQARLEQPAAPLAAGMFADVQVRRPSTGPSLSVEQTAIVASAYGDTVFIAEPNGAGWRAKRVAVQTGDSWGNRIEVLSGLKAGQKVVLSGQIKLSDGSPLQAVRHNSLAPDGSAP